MSMHDRSVLSNENIPAILHMEGSNNPYQDELNTDQTATLHASEQMRVSVKDANIADQMSQDAPDVDTFMIVKERREKNEFGLMAPKKGISCTPESVSIQFLKLLKDYLQ